MNRKLILTILMGRALLFSCSLTPNTKISGVINLNKKQELLKIGLTNQNDTITYLGETILKEYSGNNNWIYIETEERKNIFGKKKLTKNNILLLTFNNRGVLIEKHMLNISDLKKLKLDSDETAGASLDSSFTKKVLASLRKRMQNKMKTE